MRAGCHYRKGGILYYGLGEIISFQGYNLLNLCNEGAID
jgi:hypothetical protein